MLHTRHIVSITLAVLALSAAVGWAQTPATAPAEDAPKLVPADPNAGAPPTGDPNAGGPTTAPAKRDGGGSWLFGGNMWFLFIMIGALVLMMLWSGRARRKQAAKKREMIEAMKKGDKVATIGGIIGTIIEVKGNEVVVKVDEQNNIRMRFLRSAIHHIGDVPATDKEQSR